MMTTFLADIQLPEYVDAHLRWFIAGGLILIAMVVSGFNDLSKLSLYRIRAIASVCFQESIRKRVLWIIPLAIVGVTSGVVLRND